MAVEFLIEAEAYLEPSGILVEAGALGSPDASAVTSWDDLYNEVVESYCDDFGDPNNLQARKDLLEIADNLEKVAHQIRGLILSSDYA